MTPKSEVRHPLTRFLLTFAIPCPGRWIGGDDCTEHPGHRSLPPAGAGPGQHPVAGHRRLPGPALGGSALLHRGSAIAGPGGCVLLRTAETVSVVSILASDYKMTFGMKGREET